MWMAVVRHAHTEEQELFMKTMTFVSVVAAGLCALSPVARASSGLVPPVEIRDTADPWQLQVVADAARSGRLVATRVLRDTTRVLGRETVPLPEPDAAPGPAARVRRTLAVERGELERLGDGLYTVRLVVDASAPTSVDAAYRAQRTLYFRVQGGAVERIDIRAYSQAADPTHLEPDAAGRPVPVHAGTVGPARADEPAAGADRQVSSADRAAVSGATKTHEN
jgi:hypothetical protein